MYHAYPQQCSGGGFIVSYNLEKEDPTRKDYSHIRAYVLTYLAIAMWDAAIALGDKLVGTSVDAIWVNGPLPEEISHSDTATEVWGMFRKKPHDGAMPGTGEETTTLAWEAEAITEKMQPLPQIESRRPLTFCFGQGGSGKTHKALRQFEGRRVRVLAPTNTAADDLRSEGKNPHKHPVETYHQFFHLKVDEERKVCDWEPATMGKAALNVDVVIWDEFPMAGPELLEKTVTYLRRCGVIVVLCGDPMGQLPMIGDPASGQKVMYVDMGDGVDWRARDCPRLQEAKNAAWCMPDHIQFHVLQNTATEVSRKEMIDLWAPGDIIIEATNTLGNDLRTSIADVRAKKYPDTPIPLVFRPRAGERKKYRKIKGVLPLVKAPNGKFISAAVGAKVEVQPGTKYDTLWAEDTVTTVHSVQGQTIKAPRRIFICLDNIERTWCHNAAYVAMSRAERADQLYIFYARPGRAAAMDFDWEEYNRD
jgi:hypothetical protein